MTTFFFKYIVWCVHLALDLSPFLIINLFVTLSLQRTHSRLGIHGGLVSGPPSDPKSENAQVLS
jgi:hypothetical protein